VARKIIGPVEDGEVWQMWYNREAYVGRTCDQNDGETPESVMNYNPQGKRIVERPGAKCIDVANNDIRMVRVANWRIPAKTSVPNIFMSKDHSSYCGPFCGPHMKQITVNGTHNCLHYCKIFGIYIHNLQTWLCSA
jgi:hypothetical protein